MPNTPVKNVEYMLTCEDTSWWKIYPCETQMNTIHGEQHYTCEACEIGFNQQNNTKQYIKTIHGVNNTPGEPVKKNLN